MSEENIKNEYQNNKLFRDYVNKYSYQYKISIDEALTHELVKQACLYYTDV